ncbi:hypothetical protein [Chryseobacterium sp. JUb7]|uniref:hypothetical protein n=1 Tax=Chryseobacterium sp. JUb7 TaxID=2940599 RepID=UPI0021684F7F|nr:hypothetical protein [Chryseobacterium sp. JUb7]MCS3530606.1 uncharacterized protein YdeI (YjbR/CyaY-like superfamily) [Chryseobacterium sp. JUb7]
MEISPFQYIITNKKNDFPINNGEIFYHNNLSIQVHPSNKENLICKEDVIFFGECFDFENPKFSNKEIVDSLLHRSIDQKIEKLNKLTGFFTFVFFNNDNIYIFNDAAGQLETYIFNENNKLYISAQPNLIKNGENIHDDNAPRYIIDRKINIFSKTPFKYISKLIPNFYYDVKNKKFVRFYPEDPLPLLDNSRVAKEALAILEASIESMSQRKNISIAVTAGWDSRILFASSLKSADKINYYVLNHKTEDGKQDVKIAGEITDTFSKELKVIDYDISSIEVEEKNTSLWKDDIKSRKMANLMNIHFSNRYLINGNISEVARNFYDPLPRYLSLKDICYILGLKDGAYEREAIREWKNTTSHNIHLLDYIYWEHKMPNWAGSSKSISNVYNIVISPFNNRYLLGLLLSTKRKDRDKYFHKIYELILKNVSEGLAKIPINPTKKHHQIEMMKKAGIYPLYRNIFFKLRKLKF